MLHMATNKHLRYWEFSKKKTESGRVKVRQKGGGKGMKHKGLEIHKNEESNRFVWRCDNR